VRTRLKEGQVLEEGLEIKPAVLSLWPDGGNFTKRKKQGRKKVVEIAAVEGSNK